MNYYPQRDGQIDVLNDGSSTSSELLQAHLPRSQVVKAFNNIHGRPPRGPWPDPRTAPDRSALTLAGDDADAKAPRRLSPRRDRLRRGRPRAPRGGGWRTQPGTAAYGTMYASDLSDWSAPAQPASTEIVAAQAARSQR